MLTMSVKIPQIDLSVIPVGKTGSVDLNKVQNTAPYKPGSSDSPAHLRMFNDSGSELGITSDDGSIDDYIPAGAWPVYELDQTTRIINFKVIAILPNPPIQLLLCTYYAPGEKVPDSPTLGNSPVGIGGSVSTTGSTLSNEGNAAPLLVIDMGDTLFPNLITIYNDGHMSWSTDNAGVKVPVFHIDVLGNFILDTIKGLTTGLISTPVDNTSWVAVSGTAGVIDTRIQGSHQVRLQVPGGTDQLIAGVASITINPPVTITTPSTLTVDTVTFQNGSLNRLATNTASVGASSAVVINHGMHAAPVQVLAVTDQSLSSGTCSAYSYTTTQFTLFNGAGATLVYRWWCGG